MAETETKPQPKAKKKPEGLDRDVRHLGVFTNFRKQEFPAYLEFHDEEGAGRGFALYCSATHKEFKPGVRIMTNEHLKAARIDFKFTGTEPADKAKSKPITKSKRNAAMAAQAPKPEDD